MAAKTLPLYITVLSQCTQYASDYQQKSACQDATCSSPSRVTQKIFATLVVPDKHVNLTLSFKLVSY